uniref:Uncharacterized protein n=1 Tax=Anguilla anguilla TaxID=7936 RepID=A0A0E9PHW8_ANGAN
MLRAVSSELASGPPSL